MVRTEAATPVKRVTRGELGPVDQVRVAFRRKNRLAAAMGALLGGIIPLASHVVAHGEIDKDGSLFTQLGTYFVLAALLYSAKTVYQWGKVAFRDGTKAFGFVVLMEGIMVASRTGWLSVAALVYLMVINAVATACTLALRNGDDARKV